MEIDLKLWMRVAAVMCVLGVTAGAPVESGRDNIGNIDKASLKEKLERLSALLQTIYVEESQDSAQDLHDRVQDNSVHGDVTTSTLIGPIMEEDMSSFGKPIAQRSPSYQFQGPKSREFDVELAEAIRQLDLEHEDHDSPHQTKFAAFRSLNENAPRYAGGPADNNGADTDGGRFGHLVASYDASSNQQRQLRFPEMGKFHDQAVDDVEVRLLHDLQTAGDIGLTMADLIDDLEGKVFVGGPRGQLQGQGQGHHFPSNASWRRAQFPGQQQFRDTEADLDALGKQGFIDL